MSYVINAVLCNAHHPEHSQVTIPFPIPTESTSLFAVNRPL